MNKYICPGCGKETTEDDKPNRHLSKWDFECKNCGTLYTKKSMIETKTFETGAVRSTDADSVRYDLITPIGLRRLAETYKEGSDKYGDWNWLKGMPVGDTLNHVIKHIYQYLSGDTSEDHLAHAAWGLFTTMHFEETDRKELFNGLQFITETSIRMGQSQLSK